MTKVYFGKDAASSQVHYMGSDGFNPLDISDKEIKDFKLSMKKYYDFIQSRKSLRQVIEEMFKSRDRQEWITKMLK